MWPCFVWTSKNSSTIDFRGHAKTRQKTHVALGFFGQADFNGHIKTLLKTPVALFCLDKHTLVVV